VQRLDRNGDNKISRQEFDGPAQAFDHFDRNHDGSITADEAPTGPPPNRQ
jgi:Ca2+-binding EF-hand superfamily protein